ncbi:hypothetical protein Pmani_005291 [Petrolisthes manimaculis]|uniref:Cytochrome c oxidase subunit 6B1 n=1 Tax=Petrolisthes manimaculis TaxID=1843537 RepID=A0AAE1QF89_9EUCA|nr:hypothetical protein Pmani_005291 [Petrolisthes manimaculis]
MTFRTWEECAEDRSDWRLTAIRETEEAMNTALAQKRARRRERQEQPQQSSHRLSTADSVHSCLGDIMSATAIMSENKLETAPFDPRFPNQNQAKYCYQSFVDYHRCQKLKGEEYEPCEYFKKVFTSICPNAWVEKWNDQLEAGTFPGTI